MTQVVGLDLSLTSTGVATVTHHSAGWTVDTGTLPTKRSSDALADLLARMRWIAQCAEVAEHADLVVVEGLSLGSHSSSTQRIAALWFLLVKRLARDEIPSAVVAPTALKRYGTGRGNAGRRSVTLHVSRMWPDVTTRSGDEDDALVLASMGADWLGLPVPFERTAYRAKALAGVQWPDTLEGER